MAVHRSASDDPSWVEVSGFDVFTLDQGEEDAGRRHITRTEPTEIITVLSGEVVVTWPTGQITLKRRNWLQLPKEPVLLTSMRTEATHWYPCEVMHIRGDWSGVTGVAAFQFRPDKPLEEHYHDYNEYWLIYRGHFEALLDGEAIPMRPGDMLATGIGHEHGMRPLTETVEGVGFETALRPGGRAGHLHRDTDGPPQP